METKYAHLLINNCAKIGVFSIKPYFARIYFFVIVENVYFCQQILTEMSTATLNGLLEYLFATLTPDNQKWLGEHLIEHAENVEDPMRPYTMEEINAMLEESERDFEEGRCYSTEEAIQMCKEEISQLQIV